MLRVPFSTYAAALLVASSPAWALDAEKVPPTPVLSLLQQIDQGFVQVFEKVAPTVVVIEAVKKDDEAGSADFRRFDFLFREHDGKDAGRESSRERFQFPRESRSEGSGFVIRPDGYILTNHHVVAEAEKLDVRLKDGRRFPARLIAADDKTDIAVIKIEASDLFVAELGDSEKLRVGQLVCAIGAPFNQDYSFTCGWVSGIGRSNLLAATSKTIVYEDYIQTDAFINPGNSGGPLFDVQGRVIGMNTLINGLGRGLAFAIPSTMLADVAEQLIANGKVQRSWLGIRIETLTENASLRQHLSGIDRGVVVNTIEADAPAYRSDLRPTDVITDVDGVPVNAARDLQKQIVRKKVGQLVELTVWRGGKTLRIPVATGELPGNLTKVSAPLVKKSADAWRDTLGMNLKDTGGDRVIVVEVSPNSPASRAGLQAEDLITDVETNSVKSVEGVLDAIAASNGRATKKGVLLNIERKGQRTYAVLELGD